MSNACMVAIYARVSSSQQVKGGTIESQLTALKERALQDGVSLADDMVFTDAGVSGATLIRPQLERLRDRAALGLIDCLYILSPDRLSRKYAHQVLLMEELSACGVSIIFLNHAIGTSPEEALLLQMQGMISEYERVKIMERNRRGKLHAAKRGSINVLSNTPHGYRYIRKQDGTPAQYVIELGPAATIRNMFHWVGVERLSIGEVVRRLDAAGVETHTGKAHWDRIVKTRLTWGALRLGRPNPKTSCREFVPRVTVPTRLKKPIPLYVLEPIEWVEISVPAIIILVKRCFTRFKSNLRKIANMRGSAAEVPLIYYKG